MEISITSNITNFHQFNRSKILPEHEKFALIQDRTIHKCKQNNTIALLLYFSSFLSH